jgi:hypothetical protein
MQNWLELADPGAQYPREAMLRYVEHDLQRGADSAQVHLQQTP